MAPKPKSSDSKGNKISSSTSEIKAKNLPIRTEKSKPATPKAWTSLNQAEKSASTTKLFLETGAWKNWPEAVQREFLKSVEQESGSGKRRLGRDKQGRSFEEYPVEEYELLQEREAELRELKKESWKFRERAFLARRKGIEEGVEIKEEEIEEERNRRKRMVVLEGRREGDVGRYSGDPEWDDVVPLLQEESLAALASIAYTDEYAEAISYLRAVMTTSEHSPRIIQLTSHIISLNPAHYTVWLYRARTLFALNSPLLSELAWLNTVALANQKNYQIWHHRQLIMEFLYPSPSSSTPSTTGDQAENEDGSKRKLLTEEFEFMNVMLTHDSKNYHVWSYRQWLIRHLHLFTNPEFLTTELNYISGLLTTDIRNNSAFSHRFFLLFNNPEYCTPNSKPTQPDELLLDGRGKEVVQEEIEACKGWILQAPGNASAWGYLRGVLRKGGVEKSDMSCFVGNFVDLGDGDGEGKKEDIKSAQALEFLADVWEEKGEKGKAGRAWGLLGAKYDPVRRNYWEWRREGSVV